MDFKKMKVLVLARKKAVSVINVKNRGGITYNILVRAAILIWQKIDLEKVVFLFDVSLLSVGTIMLVSEQYGT